MSNYLETAILNAVFRGTTFTSPSTVYVALYTTDPGDSDEGTEVSGGSYARKAVTFTAPVQEETKGVIRNSANIDFAVATASWGLVSHIGIRDAATGGNLLFHGSLLNVRDVREGDQFRILAGQLTLTMS